jgi:hypothetical protein
LISKSREDEERIYFMSERIADLESTLRSESELKRVANIKINLDSFHKKTQTVDKINSFFIEFF